MRRTMKLTVEIHCTISVAISQIVLGNKTKRMQEISAKNVCVCVCCKLKAFHHDVLPRFVLNKFKVLLFMFQNSVKCLAIDFETYVFSHNSYSKPVCLMSANLPISHFPIAFLSCLL